MMTTLRGSGSSSGHITLLFSIQDNSNDLLEQGSRGVGLCIDTNEPACTVIVEGTHHESASALNDQKILPLHQTVIEELAYFCPEIVDYTWVIDPIDGTRSFIIGNPTWSNLIALNYKGRPVIGLANFPKLNKYYLNQTDKAAHVYDKGKKRKLTVNRKVSYSQMKVAGAFHGWLSLNKQKKIPKVLKLMQFPCFDALSYCHLCEGRIDVVLQCINQVWDIHPIIPIVKASGGFISTWKNEDAVKAGNILVSANNSAHNKILKLLKPIR